MTAKVNHPTKGSAEDYGDAAHAVITSTGSSVDGKIVPYAVLLDPATGLPALPSATLGAGPITLADGADVVQGATTDAAGANSVLGQLKTLAGGVGSYYTHTFTATGTGSTVDLSAAPASAYSVQVSGVGATATSWTVTLQASLDAISWQTALTHQTSTGNGTIVHAADIPVAYLRAVVSAVTLGSATGLQVSFAARG